ncbi:uncharacterized protein LOC141528342 isoform X1 [Cotesia typhae]|uniref:uncharacterized protein LOC141528342 isoform X1 n=2 Tax=Cotesia typhae TaxID=2053667 RepID=UPI003D69A3A0
MQIYSEALLLRTKGQIIGLSIVSINSQQSTMPWTIFKKLLLFNIIAILAINNYTSAATNHRKRYIQRNNNNNNNNLSTNQDYNNTNNINTSNNNNSSEIEKNAPKNIQDMLKDDKELPDDTAKWDSLQSSSTGNGKEKKFTRDDDDDKKTLAQQVKEGKYGLIQNELSPKKPKRPGIISYSSNPDIPRDNAKNFGGLDNEEIWLAENHLLVIKGGNYDDNEKGSRKNLRDWEPIDDYQAPKRQVRIPANPKIPPPFPIQLTDGGPIKIIGRNSSESDDNESSAQWIIPDGLVPFNGTYFIQNESSNDTNSNDEDDGRKTKSSPTFAGIIGPFFPALPPGAIFVPPPSNQTDYDEDDQSIYYPPVYSFKYQLDNSTVVPPGPLVPGIILPPPPDFFAPLEENNETVKDKVCLKCNAESVSTTAKSEKINKINRMESSTRETPKAKLKYSPVNKNKLDNYISIPATTPKSNVIEGRTEKAKVLTSTPKKIRPIVTYYSTTPYKKLTEKTTPTPVTTEKLNSNLKASYYYYEEENEVTTPEPINYQDNEARLSYYKLVVKELPPKSIYRKLRPSTPLPVLSSTISTTSSYYDVEITPSQQTLQDYQTIEPPIQSLKPQVKNSRVQGQRMLKSNFETTNPYYDKQFISSSPAPVYNFKPIITSTPRPREFLSTTKKYITNKVRSKPIYQYSFQAVNYAHDPIVYQNNGADNNDSNEDHVDNNENNNKYYNKWQVQKEFKEEKLFYNKWQDDLRYNDDRFRVSTNKFNYASTTQAPVSVLRHRGTTVSSNNYYTKQEDQYLDDVTKEYFTNFGRKIKYRLPSTTPIYSGSTEAYESVTQRPRYQIKPEPEDRDKNYYDKEIKENEYYDNIYSLKNDINVNYQRPLSAINPDAEFIDDYDSQVKIKTGDKYKQYHYQSNYPSLLPVDSYNNYNNDNNYNQRVPSDFISLGIREQKYYERIKGQKPISFAGDVSVNYNNPPAINPDAEFIKVPHSHSHSHPQSYSNANSNVRQNGELRDDHRSYFTYRLPGDDGHVYFFTPHVINRQRQEFGGSRLRGFRSAKAVKRNK